MDCTDILKHILSYLLNYDIIKMTSLSKNINRITKETNFKFMDYDINRAYDIIKVYKNARVNLEFFNETHDMKKLNLIKDNVIGITSNIEIPEINMKNLEYLNIRSEEIKKIKIQLKKLKYLCINDYCNPNISMIISNINPLNNFNNIESLDLYYAVNVSLSLANFTNLKKLRFSHNNMRNEDIEKLVNLEMICIEHNSNITNDAFKNLNKIKVLILYKTKITSEVLKYLPNINIWSPNKSSDDNYEYMKKIKKLELLDLYYNSKISDENIKNINIERIILSGENNITINGLNKNIKRIYIYGNPKIRDKDLKKLNLTLLKLHGNTTISDMGLKFCKDLKMLDLSFNYKITNEGLVNMKNLEYLSLKVNLFNHNNITNDALKNLTKLKYLNLENNKIITDEGIKPLINLEYLNINRTKKITINGLINLKKLKEIECEESLLSKKDLHILAKNNINMKIIYQYGKSIIISPFYYSKERYFMDFDEFVCESFKTYW